MIEEQAVVLTCSGEYASVEAYRRTACNNCSAESSCGTSLLAKSFGNRPTQIKALNRIGAQPGEQVIIGLEENALVRSAFMLYAVPLMAFILAALVGQIAADRFHTPGMELISLFLGLLGLSAGLIWVKHRTSHLEAHNGCQAVILRRQSDPFSTVERLR